MTVPSPRRAVIALGANIGPREASVLGALRVLEASGAARVVRLSGLYETAAEGMGPAPPFVNAVAEVETLQSPVDLLQRLKETERHMGRTGGHNASREIDIDIIAFGRLTSDDSVLGLPHPRYTLRGFVLVPLAEILPDFVCPRTGRGIGEMLADLGPVVGGALWRVSGRSFGRVL